MATYNCWCEGHRIRRQVEATSTGRVSSEGAEGAPLTSQSRLESGIESTLNIASGFIISWLVWVFVVPLLFASIDTSDAVQSFSIVTVFTVTSWLRSFVWRRYFNARLHRRVHNLLGDQPASAARQARIGLRLCDKEPRLGDPQ